MIKIFIADDHQMFIDGIKAILKDEAGIQVVGEARNGMEVLEQLEQIKTDLLLLDINMPVMDGIETTRHLRKTFPGIKILMLTMYNNHEFISGLVHEGASGYILKNTGKKELIEAIITVHKGNNYFSKEVTETVMQHLHKKPADQKVESVQLTRREKEILVLISREFSTRQIADELFISPNTVETHRKNLMSKLNVKNIAGLVKFALQTGLIQ